MVGGRSAEFVLCLQVRKLLLDPGSLVAPECTRRHAAAGCNGIKQDDMYNQFLKSSSQLRRLIKAFPSTRVSDVQENNVEVRESIYLVFTTPHQLLSSTTADPFETTA